MGRSHAMALAARGASVVVNDILGAQNVVQEIVALGGVAVSDDNDISTDSGAAGLIMTSVDAFGGVDALVSNAAISSHHIFRDVQPDVFERTMQVNAFGPYRVAQQAWPHLANSDAARVVLISSEVAIRGLPKVSHYAAAKGAVMSLARSLAAEGEDCGILVNAVNPTAITRNSTSAARRRIARALGIDESEDEELKKRSTAAVSALITWLCHPDCLASGELFKVEGTEVAQTAFVRGVGFASSNLTVEEIRDHFGEIGDMTSMSTIPNWLSAPPD